MHWPALPLLVILAVGTSCTSRREANFAPSPPSLRVVTYNINWGMAQPNAVISFLRTTDADVVCLQETHPQWESLLRAELGRAYPHSIFVTSGGAGGIAIMAKHRLHDARPLPATAGWFPALRAEIDTPVGRVQVLNVHLRPPLSERGSATPSALYASPKIHRAELGEFLAAMDVHAPLIIAGDFNENEDDGAAGLLLKRGFTHALSLFDARTRTWEWPITSSIAIKRRYDHLFFNAGLQCTGARVAEVNASDHMPVIAVFTPTAAHLRTTPVR